MKVHTLNTLYTLTEAGDGAFLVSGHPIYCPEPLLVRLIEPPRVGRRLILVPVDAKVRKGMHNVVTTPVVSIDVNPGTCHTGSDIPMSTLPTHTEKLRCGRS